MNLSLKRKTDAVPLCSKILLKHASDALKLIRRELDPFRTYGYNPHVAFQQMGSGRSITIYTSKRVTRWIRVYSQRKRSFICMMKKIGSKEADKVS